MAVARQAVWRALRPAALISALLLVIAGSTAEVRSSEEFDGNVVLNGHPTERLPNTLNVSFPGRVGAEILRELDGVAASTGSACHSGSIELSPVLKAMRIAPETGMGAIRFSLGRTTTEEEIEAVVKGLKRVLG